MLSEGTTIEPILHRFHRLRAAMGTTFVSLHRDCTAPLINHDCLMDDQPKEGRLFLCLSFVPYEIPPGGGGGGNFIPPLVLDWLLEDNLLSNPLPLFFGQVSEEGGDLWPPPTSRVKKKMIKFSKEQVELRFVAITFSIDRCEPITKVFNLVASEGFPASWTTNLIQRFSNLVKETPWGAIIGPSCLAQSLASSMVVLQKK